jgi:hypothetical protein
MKAISFTLICLSVLFSSLLKAQDPKTNSTSTSTGYSNDYLFDKGKWVFDLKRNLNYSHFNNYSGDNKYGESNSFGISLGADYMFKRGLGVGLDLSLRTTGDKNSQGVTDFQTRDWMAWADFRYARPLGSVNWYVQPAVGYGMQKDISTNSSGGTNEDKTTDLGFRLTTGFPINLGGPVYLDPHLCYQRDCFDFDDGEESRNKFGVGIGLIAGLNSSQMACDSKQGYRQSKLAYQKGNMYLDYYTRGMYDFGNTITNYNTAPDNDIKSDFSRGRLNVGWSYYVINNLYAGLELSGSHDVSKPGTQNGYTFTNSDWDATLKAGFNLPVKLPFNNIFLDVAYGVGGAKDKTDDNGNVSEFKDKTSYYGAELGYNKFFGERVALTPIVFYGVYKSEQKDVTNPIEYKDKGLGFRLGVRYALNMPPPPPAP